MDASAWACALLFVLQEVAAVEAGTQGIQVEELALRTELLSQLKAQLGRLAGVKEQKRGQLARLQLPEEVSIAAIIQEESDP